MLDQYGSKLHSTISINATKQQNEAHNADNLTAMTGVEAEAMQAARDGNAEAILTSTVYYDYWLNAQTDLSAPRKAQIKQDYNLNIQRNQAIGGLDRAIKNHGLDQAAAYIEAFGKDKSLVADPTQRDKIVAEMTGHLKDAEAAAAAAKAKVGASQKADQADNIAALDLGVSRGEVGYKALEAARQQGVFDGKPERFTSLSKAVDAVNKTQQKKAANISLVASAISGNGWLDPKDPGHRKAVDHYYVGVVAPKLAGKPAAEVFSRTVDFISRTGIVPKSVASHVRASLQSGQPEKIAAASDMISRLQDLPGQVLDNFSSKDIALALKVSDLVRAGVPADQAVAHAQKQMGHANQAAVESRRSEIKSGKLPAKYSGWVNNFFNPTFFSFDATLPNGVKEQAVADFATLFEDAYIQTGDQAIAKKLAFRDMARVWATTSVDGGLRAMKYAPEAFYGIGGDSAWMSQQLLDDLGAAGRKGVDLADVTLVPDGLTARQASGGKPTYLVMVKNKDGVFEPVADKSGPMRWHPDAAKAKSEKTARLIKKARVLRQAAMVEDTLARQGFGPGMGVP